MYVFVYIIQNFLDEIRKLNVVFSEIVISVLKFTASVFLIELAKNNVYKNKTLKIIFTDLCLETAKII